MNIREQSENVELGILASYAFPSSKSAGRVREEEKCQIRTEFARDRDRVIHSKAFRRLKHKTQVFITSDNDHFRTRLTHTLEVAQIARTIAKAARLNEELVEAICLAHDLGHTPFGHAGEKILNKLNPDGFKHYEQSLRVVDVIERDGAGLNLTYEVRDGILNHSGDNEASTQEGRVVKLADRFAYINHDIDDAIRAGLIREEDLPKEYVDILGETHSQRIDSLIMNTVYTTVKNGYVSMSEEIEKAMMGLRDFLFERVYNVLAQRDDNAAMVIEKLYNHFCNNKDSLPDEYRKLLEHYELHTVVCDYIAGMTDNYSVMLFEERFMPNRFFTL